MSVGTVADDDVTASYHGYKLILVFAITASLLVVFLGITPHQLGSEKIFAIIAAMGTIVLITYAEMSLRTKVVLVVFISILGALLILAPEKIGGAELLLKAIILSIAIVSWLKRGRTLSMTEKQ